MNIEDLNLAYAIGIAATSLFIIYAYLRTRR